MGTRHCYNDRNDDPDDERLHRPGISTKFLEEHGIKRATAAELAQALGFKSLHSDGLAIPYCQHFTSGNGAKVMVNGSQYLRARLDKPYGRGPKYLAREKSGSQLYEARRPPMNQRYVIVAEGELKALALCEAGFPAVGIGGICGLMPGRKLLPAFEKLLDKFVIERVYFLGDADTLFIPQFHREVAKLVRALSARDCDLLLPRVTLDMPNGVDDCREQLGFNKFESWWNQIMSQAVLIACDCKAIPSRIDEDGSMLGGSIAIGLVKHHLCDISRIPGRWQDRLLFLTSELRRLDQLEMSKTLSDVLDLSPAEFLKAASEFARRRQIAEERDAATARSVRGDKAVFDDSKIIESCGTPYTVTRSGPQLNQAYFVARFIVEHRVLFEQEEARFYLYNAVNGAWERVASDNVKKLLSRDFLRIIKEELNAALLCAKMTDSFLNSVVNGIRAGVSVKDIFKRLKAEDLHDGLIHVQNGMLTIKVDGRIEAPTAFSADYYSRNVLEFIYDPDAKCPKFEAALKYALPDDFDLFVKMFGGCLIQGNSAQKVMLLEGEANSMKSVLLTIIERIIGKRNVATLRTHLLHERFEIARFSGKTLLTAKDVAGDFLQHESAQKIKSLCGGDGEVGEFKGSMEEIAVSGDYHFAIGSNERMLVRLHGTTDANAWARRLVLFTFLHPVKNIIPKYEEVLLAEEGAGIFALAVRGAQRYLKDLKDLKDHGTIQMSDKQRKRVDNLIYESQSLEIFLSKNVERRAEVDRADLSTEEIVAAFSVFCQGRNWKMPTQKTIERRLVDLMRQLFGSEKSNHIERNDERVNGYPNVAFVAQSKV